MSAPRLMRLMPALVLAAWFGAAAPATADERMFQSDEGLFELVALVCRCEITQAARAPLLQLRALNNAMLAARECAEFGYRTVPDETLISIMETLMDSAEQAGVNRLGSSYAATHARGRDFVALPNLEGDPDLDDYYDYVRQVSRACAQASYTPLGAKIMIRPSAEVEAVALRKLLQRPSE